jgi:CheY-like chemotaxis protein
MKQGADMENDKKRTVVLLVEDDLGDQKLMKTAIMNQGCELELMITLNGESAMNYLQMCKQEPQKYQKPCLILLDLNMPGMGGKEFLRQIKKNDALSAIPVVVVTTSDSETDIKECYELQAAGYIQKAAMPAEFNEILRKLVRYWFLTSAVLRV